MSSHENNQPIEDQEPQDQNQAEQNEPVQNNQENAEQQQNNVEDDGYEDVEVETDEEIPKEEYDQLVKEAQENGETEQVSSTRRIKIFKRVKKEGTEEPVAETKINIEQLNANLVSYFQEQLESNIDKYDNEYWKESYTQTFIDFANNDAQIVMFVWCEAQGLGFQYNSPPSIKNESFDSDICYFIKIPNIDTNVYEYNAEDIGQSFTVGKIQSNYLKGLLIQMNLQFIPSFVKDNSWPENAKKEFLAQLHKFMAILTEVAYLAERYTELYIPNEDLRDTEAARSDKDLIQRLETNLIGWYRQIKEVVQNQDNHQDSENAGPLDEISYWRSRKNNLTYIDEQLEKPELKKILKILQDAQSSYVNNFIDITKQIKSGSVESEDNLLFLQSLYQPCKQLQEYEPREIPFLLPNLLNRVRMIWEKSRFYNTPERIQSLLQKISNEIIKRCKETISIKDMLDGDVENCMEDLQNSIECGKKWRSIYTTTSALILKKNKNAKWDFNLNTIFAQVDAFVQRCVELREICEGQLQFSRRGKDTQVPQFGGSKGPEIIAILEEIKQNFLKNLEKIRGTDQDKILDVRPSRWHEDFNAFKIGMKDLDVMYQNIINSAFESVTTVQQGVELLEAFDYLAKRDSIKSCVRQKAQKVLNLFASELDAAKYEFDNVNTKKLNIPINHGKYSGQAIWVRCLMHRMDTLKQSVDKLNFIDDSLKKIALEKYDTYYQTFRQFIVNQKLKEWKEENKDFEENTINPRLDKPILIKIDENSQELVASKSYPASIMKSKIGYLESNFDRQLLKLIKECVSWKKLANLGVVIPNYADDLVLVQKEHLRVLREYVMLVVRDYNQIIESMDETEKKLFKQHLELTERVIYPGLIKLRWSTKGILEGFVRDCRKSCADLFSKLKIFQTNAQKIQDKCVEISQKSLIKIDKKRIYEIRYFEEEQEAHRKEMSVILEKNLQDIRDILNQTFEHFVFQRPDIQKIWFKYVAEVDHLIEEALKKAVKISLIELQKVIGDDKVTPIPIFKLSVELEQNKLGFNPTTDYLIAMARQTTAAMTEVIRDFKRMEHLMYEERRKILKEAAIQQENELKNPIPGRAQKPMIKLDALAIDENPSEKDSFYEKISEDHDVKKYTDKILAQLKNTFLGLGDHLHPWKKQTWYWSQGQKEKFIRQILDRNDNISNLKGQIELFENIQSEIQGQKTSEQSGCIVLDNNNIKSTLVDIMINWQNTYLKAIEDRSVQQLQKLHQRFTNDAQKLGIYPTDLISLKANQDLLTACVEDKANLEEQLGPLEDKFKLLDEYNIGLKEDAILQRNNVKEAWTEFIAMLDRIEVRNQKVSSDLYQDCMSNLGQFKKETEEHKAMFIGNAPFQSTGVPNDKAFSLLSEYKDSARTLRRREENMKFGFDLFKIEYKASPDLEFVELNIKTLEMVWSHKENWDKRLDQLKLISFQDVDVEELDDECEDNFVRPINRYESNVKKMEVVAKLKVTLEEFRSTLPLISMLRQPYIRTRHWEKIEKLIANEINPESDTFTLGEVFKLNLLQHQESVREVCEVAREEYKIESAMARIKDKWATLELIMEPHKKTYKIKTAEEIYATLEDHMAVLSAQKTTLFYDNFKEEIELWENDLSKTLETLEQLIAVQRQWIYLESIFASQQNDQDKQLIGDISKFQQVNVRFAYHMQRIWDDKNALRAMVVADFYNDLLDMAKKLDESQKILFQLLERKRKEFPRFYFLSNDDLFELLGNTKDPSKVNKHVKKCFEGIKKLEFKQLSMPGRSRNVESFEVTHLQSPEGEVIELVQKVPCELGVENWLKAVEKQMRESLKRLLMVTSNGMKRKDGMKWVGNWIQNYPGQLLITCAQIFWTKENYDAITKLYESEKQDKNRVWKFARDEKRHFIEELTKQVRKPSNEVVRLKLVALITIMVHSRDILEQLYKTCNSPNSFEWLKQLRFYQQPQGEGYDCYVEHINASSKFVYGFEYQGNNGRLVATALTDRCYVTLTSAMLLKKGGAPQGPAGTGKTETVKDLGKSLAKFVLVINCSDGMDYKSLGRVFSGLVQTGGWGCFDEFNRIEVEVLSVIAQQVSSILSALKEYHPERYSAFAFEGEVIQINEQVAIFITMNPGYAGRSELPDNLKSLFRPVSMMVPDFTVICEIMLQSEGFRYGRPLAIKMVTLQSLMVQQMSKQTHYDYGMRAIKSILNCAGAIKRETKIEVAPKGEKGEGHKKHEDDGDELVQETLILMRAIRDMNFPKFVADDIPLFQGLFQDLFPNIDLPDADNPMLLDGVEVILKQNNLQVDPQLMQKILQLYDSKNTRHGNMLVGKTLSGKSTCWKILQQTMNHLNKEFPTKFPQVKLEILNPKSVTINELFGYVDIQTMEWNEGLLSSMMSRLCKDETDDQKWMILDGPVDTLWIESMNTVLDDNKVLTLLNGDRISMNPTVGLVFEVQDLAVASPATVSRAGMIYLDINDMKWDNYAASWIHKFKDEQLQEYLHELFEKWIPRLFKCKNNFCKELIPVSENAAVMGFCKLLDAIQKQEPAIHFDKEKKEEVFWNQLEKWFAFCLIWTIGASVDENGRNQFDYHMRDIESMFPNAMTVYDYYINHERQEWGLWDEKVGQSWKPAPNQPFHKMFVPTSDTVRNRYVIQQFIKEHINILTVGITGTGKTALINGILAELDDTYSYSSIVFSGQTSSEKTQQMIESKLVKRSKTKLVPVGKNAVFFLDDLNMPKYDTFGSQPPLELIRQWMDYGGWYDRTFREQFKQLIDIQFICAMGPPSGGRFPISQRLQSKLSVLNFVFPSDKQVQKIFQSILANKFSEFDEEIKPLSEPLAIATLNLFKVVSDQFLATPGKSHYQFNMRDMSKVIQGLYQINRFYCDTKITAIRVWVHECLRVFHDRLTDFQDRTMLKGIIAQQLEMVLQTNMKECTNDDEEDTIFVDFMDDNDNCVYQEVNYHERELLKNSCEKSLANYNEKARSKAMNIVLFQDAIQYVCKIHRIIKLGKGHGLLVGEGGSGRHSLTQLAAFIAGYELWQCEISKNYRLKEFREDIKKWCELAGVKNKPGVFLFSDNQIVNEAFVEDINNILTVGEIPNLFSPKEDLPAIRDKVKKEWLRENTVEGKDAPRVSEDELTEFFFTRMMNNFHLIICMSKTGDNLRNYTRMYPGLMNNTTIIWYMPWPKEALIEVAYKYLTDIDISKNLTPTDQEEVPADGKEAKKKTEVVTKDSLFKSLATFFGIAHVAVQESAAHMFAALKRRYYVTPTNYIEFVTGYVQMLSTKQIDLGIEIDKLLGGLQKLADAADSSEHLQKQLGVNQIELSKNQKEVEDLMIQIENDTLNAMENQKEVDRRTLVLNKEKIEINALAADAQRDLEKAEPILRAAESGLEKLEKKKIAEIKAYAKPPPQVETVCSVIMIILGKDPSWMSVKKELTDAGFLDKLKNYDKENMSQNTIKKIEKYTSKPEMDVDKVYTISSAAGSMWEWVLAMESFAKAFKDIEPKRKKVISLKEKLQKSEDELALLQENCVKLKEMVITLNTKLETNKNKMISFQEKTTTMQVQLDRAEKLLGGLANTKDVWSQRSIDYQEKYKWLVGDSLITAACMSYMGPFPSEYRDKLLNDTLLKQVRLLKIPFSKDYEFSSFLAKPTDFLKWSIQGLPDDQFSRDNGVLVTKGRRFPLMIDPQQQANSWLKNMEREVDKDKLIVLDQNTENYMTKIERSISQGMAVVLQNIEETLDPGVESVLKKQIKKVAGKFMMYLGEKEVLYDPNFRFYMTTKLANPTYKPEISTQVTLVNFTVKEFGLEEQLCSVVIQKMEQNLEKQRVELIIKRGMNDQKLKQLDEEILQLLSDTKGSLIEDDSLIKALQNSKEVEEDVRSQIESSATAMRKTLAARENYRRLARVASKIFFIVNAFSQLEHMYQLALDTYINLFSTNILKYLEKNPALSDTLDDKLDAISERHKQEVYKYCCRGLFEKDKLLLSLSMAVNLSTDIDQLEYEFFLRGVPSVNTNPPANPNPEWITQAAWDMIIEIEKMANFTGIIGAFVHNSKEWKRWFMSATPESDALPGEWEQKCDQLRKMILLKAIRPDRVLFAATAFISFKIGEYFINPPPVAYDKIYEDSNKINPIIFILAAGVDPFTQLNALAIQKERTLVSVSLGQGQAKKAKEKIFEGTKLGQWIYLANCHLTIDFLRDLEKILENFEQSKGDVHQHFRLFLSSNPTPKFPITILQKSLKVTTEPPKGLKANMLRLYNNMRDDKFNAIKQQVQKARYKKLVFALTWFHSVVIERKKFKSFGWNIIYDFNDSDFLTADNIIVMCLEQSLDKTPEGVPIIQWDAIKYLVSEVTYGGRVTDPWDRRLMNVYANQFFNDVCVADEPYNLSDPSLPYIVPSEPVQKDAKKQNLEGTTPTFYETKIRDYPSIERPEAFGQHINAEISSQIADTNNLIASITSLQPKSATGGGGNQQEILLKTIKNMQENLPECMDLEEVMQKIHHGDGNPLKVVLVQEITRYNELINVVRVQLVKLERGINGLEMISEEMEIIMDALSNFQVPQKWITLCYASLKPLTSWLNDLIERYKQFYDWVFKGQPNVFWISGFSFPTGFTTAVQQQSARKLNISIDQFTWEFSFLPLDGNISNPPKEGAYLTGFFIEGARWDYDKNFLIDAEPMKLNYPMPIIHFKPVVAEQTKKGKKALALYNCPCYVFPLRTGSRERPSYMFTVNLPCKPTATAQGLTVDTDFWIKRGTALLMSLAN